MKESFRRTLLGRSHALHPVVTIAGKGLTDNVHQEIEQALLAHELIKIKLNGEREEREDWTKTILATYKDAVLVQQIGRIIILYQPKPDQA